MSWGKRPPDLVTLYRPHKAVSMKVNADDANFADITFEDARVITIRCVIDADGARSAIRAWGIGFEDLNNDCGHKATTLAQLAPADVTFDNPGLNNLTFKNVMSTNNFLLCGKGVCIKEVVWSSCVRTHSSITDTFFWDNPLKHEGAAILFAGDAALPLEDKRRARALGVMEFMKRILSVDGMKDEIVAWCLPISKETLRDWVPWTLGKIKRENLRTTKTPENPQILPFCCQVRGISYLKYHDATAVETWTWYMHIVYAENGSKFLYENLHPIMSEIL
ncbi:hypothetical protein EDC04DRAFT_2597839 [Pisolithus marmoratus]|nr:hypothetical protein EDC04DRAFT_2597839 [Pisolithus marmoratus]